MAYSGRVYPYVFGQKGMARLTNRLIASPHDVVLAENTTFERERLEKERDVDQFGLSQDASQIVFAMTMFNPLLVTAGAGTVATTAGLNEITGTGTAFLTAFQPGDRLVTLHEDLIVDSVTSNTQIFTLDIPARTASGLSYVRKSGERLIALNAGGRLSRYVFNNGGLGLSATPTSITTGLGAALTNRPKFVQGGQEAGAQPAKLFLFTGLEVVRVLEGEATFGNISTPPTDWSGTNQPVGGIVHRGRLVGYGNANSPHRLYFSLATDHEDFTTAGTFQLGIFSNIGQRIFNTAVHNGVLFIWKWPEGLFYLDDTDLTETNWSVRVVSAALGCAPSPHAVLPMDDDVLFCDASGHFHILSAVNTLGGVRASDLTRALGLQNWTRGNINTHALATMQSSWDPVAKIAYFAMPDNGDEGGRASLLLKFDFGLVPSGGPVRFSYTNAINGTYALARMREQYIGDPGLLVASEAAVATFPLIYFLDPTGATGDVTGTGYVMTFTLPVNDLSDLDPSLRAKQKIFDGVELLFDSLHTAGTVYLDMYVDGTLRETVTISPGSSQKQVYKKLSCGAGYTLQVTLRTDDSASGLTPILGMNIWFRDGSNFHATAN